MERTVSMTRIFTPASAREPDLLDLLSHEATGGEISRRHALVKHGGLILLILTIGALLVRPADLVPSLEGAPIYELLVTACFVASLRRLGRLLGSLSKNSVISFVLLLIPAVLLSHLMSGNSYDARIGAIEQAKACILFLLVVVQIDSIERLQAMISAVAGFVVVVALLAVTQYLGLINVPALASVQQRTVDSFGEASTLYRLCGIGVFNDPNDFSLVLVSAMIVCCYGLSRRGKQKGWLLLLAPLLLCGVALYLTHSRGGLVAAISGLATFVAMRIGKRNTLMLACLCAPLIALVLLGRQSSTEPVDPGDTFQARLELWSSSFDVFRASPFFGLGQGKIAEEIGHVTHNSFLHAYAEMGLLGGTLFFGAFYLVLRGLTAATPADAHSSRLRPYMLALVAAYVAGLLSLSRVYTVPTQLILGLGAASAAILSPGGQNALPKMGFPCFIRVAGAGAMFLAATYVFLRVMLQRGPV
jgi:putative inorganic carbon (hco3(-)) transporter